MQVFHLENPGEVAPGATASSPTKKLKSTTPFKVKHFETKRGPQGFVSFSHENSFFKDWQQCFWRGSIKAAVARHGAGALPGVLELRLVVKGSMLS